MAIGGQGNEGTSYSGHLCFVKNTGSVFCRGANGYGQLGNYSTTDNSLLQQVGDGNVSITGAVSAVAGRYHTCALHSAGTVSCWGRNDRGQLGDNSFTDRDRAVQVSVIGVGANPKAVALTAGYKHTCALLDNGTAMCWGDNSFGQLGISTSTTRSNDPQTVRGLEGVGNLGGVVALAAGTQHNCALKGDGSATCWGRNSWGQLGNALYTDSSSSSFPVTLSSLHSGVTSGYRSITAGGDTSCGYTIGTYPAYTRSLVCWGDGYYGQFGNDTSGYDVKGDRDITTVPNRDNWGAANFRMGQCANLYIP